MSGAESSISAIDAGARGEPQVIETHPKVNGGGERPSILLSRTTINHNSRNTLRSLVEHGMLAEFWTTFAWDPQSRWNHLLPRPWQSQLARRSLGEAPFQQIRTVAWREAVRVAAHGTAMEKLLCSGERPFSDYGIERHFDSRVARRLKSLRPDVAYAYDGGALQTLREARQLGIVALYELVTSYWRWERALFTEEAERQPDFAGLLGGLADPSRHLERKDQELHLANYVVVPSLHVRESLRGFVAEDKIRVVSYGAPPVRAEKLVALSASQPLKVLFVGSLIQRKGISYLLEAVRMLGRQVELTLVGNRFRKNSLVDAACQQWRWFPSLPHAQVLELMQQSDVLVLPSLTEAFGLVVTEALACGLPVILTPNTGAGEMMRDGREGYIVPIRRADLIAQRLEALHRNRDLLAEMSHQAQLTAARNSWEKYRTQWAGMVRDLAWR